MNDELRAAVAKLVSEHSIPRKSTILDAVGDVPGPSSKHEAPKLSVQIPARDHLALLENNAEERGDDESDMDLSMPATPVDEATQPTDLVPVVTAEPTVSAPVIPTQATPALATVESATPAPAHLVVVPADVAPASVSERQSTSMASSDKAASSVEGGHTTTEKRSPPPGDKK